MGRRNKFYSLMKMRRTKGEPCPYCRREMSFVEYNRAPTEDRVHPRSKGGQMKVWACVTCNQAKGDMTLQGQPIRIGGESEKRKDGPTGGSSCA